MVLPLVTNGELDTAVTDGPASVTTFPYDTRPVYSGERQHLSTIDLTWSSKLNTFPAFPDAIEVSSSS